MAAKVDLDALRRSLEGAGFHVESRHHAALTSMDVRIAETVVSVRSDGDVAVESDNPVVIALREALRIIDRHLHPTPDTTP